MAEADAQAAQLQKQPAAHQQEHCSYIINA